MEKGSVFAYREIDPIEKSIEERNEIHLDNQECFFDYESN